MDGLLGHSFWEVAQQLQQKGILCDLQLCAPSVDGSSFEVIQAHKVILASSCRFFQNCLLTGELLDAYHFDGISKANLQLVIDYVYRKLSWEDLLRNSEAALAAQTIQVVPYEVPHAPTATHKRSHGQGKRPKVMFVKMMAEETKGSPAGGGSEVGRSAVSNQGILSSNTQLVSHEMSPDNSAEVETAAPAEEMQKAMDQEDVEQPRNTECIQDVTQQVEERGTRVPKEDKDMNDLMLLMDSGQAGSPSLPTTDNHDSQLATTSESKDLIENADKGKEDLDRNAEPLSSMSLVTQETSALSTPTSPSCLRTAGDTEVISCNTHLPVVGNQSPTLKSQLPAARIEFSATETDLAVVETPIAATTEKLPATESQILTAADTQSSLICEGQLLDKSASRKDGGNEKSGLSEDDLIESNLKSRTHSNERLTPDTSAVPESSSESGDCKSSQEIPSEKGKDAPLTSGNALSVHDRKKIASIKHAVTQREAQKECKRKRNDSGCSGSADKEPVRKTRSQSSTLLTPTTKTQKLEKSSSPKSASPLAGRVSQRRKHSVDYKLLSQGKNTVLQSPVSNNKNKNVKESSLGEKTGKTEVESDLNKTEPSPKILTFSTEETPMKRKRGRPPKNTFTLKSKCEEELTGNKAKDSENIPTPFSCEQTKKISEKAREVVIAESQTSAIKTDIQMDTEGTAHYQETQRGRTSEKNDNDLKLTEDPIKPQDNQSIREKTNKSRRLKVETAESTQTSEKSENNKTLQRFPPRGPNPCDQCRRDFKSEGALARHKRIIHKVKTEYRCEVCEASFQTRRALETHQKVEHQMVLFSCQHCGAQFKSREGCKIHEYKKHSAGEPLHVCEHCGKMFHFKAELKSHITFRHSDSKPHACDQCDRAFKNKQMLQRHISTFHSNVRKFQCDVCGTMFKTRPDCKAHREKHFRERNPLDMPVARGKRFPDGQKYPCQFCGKVFKKRTQQMVHENLQHKQKNDGYSFLCTICSKVFAIKHYLMQHIKNCHSERRHVCQQCGQAFSQGGDLRRHTSVAGRCKGEPAEPKPYACPHCGKGFSLKGNLGKHLHQPGRCRGNSSNTPEVIVVLQQAEGDMILQAEMSDSADGQAAASQDGGQYQAHDLQLQVANALQTHILDGTVHLEVEVDSPDHVVSVQDVEMAADTQEGVTEADMAAMPELTSDILEQPVGRVEEVAYLLDGIPVTEEEVLSQEVLQVHQVVDLHQVMQLQEGSFEIIHAIADSCE